MLYPTLMMDAAYDDTDRLVLGYRHVRSTGLLRELRATDGFGIINLKAGATWDNWRLQLIPGNLFDRTYREHFSYLRNPFRSGVQINEPGRNVTFTLGWRM